ncbi:hypothetical protein VTG60DRAFT_3699 [Thermothelomyces hinnuleus]
MLSFLASPADRPRCGEEALHASFCQAACGEANQRPSPHRRAATTRVNSRCRDPGPVRQLLRSQGLRSGGEDRSEHCSGLWMSIFWTRGARSATFLCGIGGNGAKAFDQDSRVRCPVFGAGRSTRHMSAKNGPNKNFKVCREGEQLSETSQQVAAVVPSPGEGPIDYRLHF